MSASLENIYDKIRELDSLLTEAQNRNDTSAVEVYVQEKKRLMSTLNEMNNVKSNKLLTDSAINTNKNLLNG